MDRLTVGGASYSIRRAERRDVAAIVELLHDDDLGGSRELDDLAPYEAAFEAIDRDENHLLVVAKEDSGAVVATMQLTLLPGLARGGATRLQIEAVRIAGPARGTGLGTALFEWAHDYGRERGAALAQLTTDKTRADAHRFYDRLGYEATHQGMKRSLLDG
ncbi:MAG TPA: GNAT family N-acetyltransferase [Nocardioides sp.]|nr:GNAT family N-acetyltransferase [Nocardioides sp.]